MIIIILIVIIIVIIIVIVIIYHCYFVVYLIVLDIHEEVSGSRMMAVEMGALAKQLLRKGDPPSGG